jgi:hypothetical protein
LLKAQHAANQSRDGGQHAAAARAALLQPRAALPTPLTAPLFPSRRNARDVRTRATEDGEGGQWYTRPCGPNSLEVSSVQELVDVLVREPAREG